MPDPTLYDFIDQLAAEGLLHRIPQAVASRFEVAECVRQLRKGSDQAPAVFFERISDKSMPVLASIYSSPESIALAFGVGSIDELPARISNWLQPSGGRGVRDVLAILPALTRSLPWRDSGTKARCQQIVRVGRDVDLTQLPIPHCWPAESGPALTAGQLITRDSEDTQTVETAAAELVDATTLRVRFTDGSAGLDAWNTARASGRQLDIALALGGPPALWPTVWLGEVLGIDSNVLGEVFGRPQPETVRGRTVSATLPAACELVLEGRIDPESSVAESGRITSDWGRMTESGTWANVSVHAITHAAASVLPIIVRHAPPHDLTALDQLAERCLEALVVALVPGVVRLSTPCFGAARQVVLATVSSAHTPRAREIAAALRGLHCLAKSKVVVMLDEDVPIDDSAAVLAAIVESTAPERDMRIVDAALNPEDPSAHSQSSAVIIDATSTVHLQQARKARPSPAVADAVHKLLEGR